MRAVFYRSGPKFLFIQESGARGEYFMTEGPGAVRDALSSLSQNEALIVDMTPLDGANDWSFTVLARIECPGNASYETAMEDCLAGPDKTFLDRLLYPKLDKDGKAQVGP
jgi:hypothetical protein